MLSQHICPGRYSVLAIIRVYWLFEGMGVSLILFCALIGRRNVMY